MCRNISLLFLTIAVTPCMSRLLHRHADRFSFVTDSSNPTCAPLDNKGSHFTVNIKVGTPGQSFAVVADTGSDSIIVPSCICREQGSCSEKDRCFRGTNKSSTFLLKGFNSTQLQAKMPHHVPVVNMVFGSGPVQAVVATDVVEVGGLKAKMQDGVLLMVEHQLRMNGPFEGILGLGQPKNETELLRLQKEQQKEVAHAMQKRKQEIAKLGKMRKESSPLSKQGAVPHGNLQDELKAIDNIIKKAMANGGGGMEDAIGNIAQQHPRGLQALAMSTDSQPLPLQGIDTVDDSQPGDSIDSQDIPKHSDVIDSQEIPKQSDIVSRDSEKIPGELKRESYKTKSFLQSAGISRFSLCFNDEGKEGALHLSPPKAENVLASVGTVHWGLDFQGVSVGNSSVPAKFCSPASKKDGQQTACGGIPDSGTTLFMGPEEHIEMLFEGICDGWERCRKAVSTGLQKKKVEVLMMLLSQCGSWMTEGSGLEELPALHFQLADVNGKKQTLSLDGAAYIIEQNVQNMKVVVKNIMGMPVKVPKKTGTRSKVCAPAFGPMDMQTKKNGPVWILGSPLFYEYTVGYDLNKESPGISFTKQACGCSQETALVSSGKQGGKRKARQPRLLEGPPRVPDFDLSMGL